MQKSDMLKTGNMYVKMAELGRKCAELKSNLRDSELGFYSIRPQIQCLQLEVDKKGNEPKKDPLKQLYELTLAENKSLKTALDTCREKLNMEKEYRMELEETGRGHQRWLTNRRSKPGSKVRF